MKKRYVVTSNQCKTYLPINATIVGWLLLDRMRVQDWAWGAWWTCMAIIWAMAIWLISSEVQVEILDLKP